LGGRPLTRGQALNGAMVGILLAVIDLVSLVALAAPFAWIFVISNGGKIICATLGGLAAARVGGTVHRQ